MKYWLLISFIFFRLSALAQTDTVPVPDLPVQDEAPPSVPRTQSRPAAVQPPRQRVSDTSRSNDTISMQRILDTIPVIYPEFFAAIRPWNPWLVWTSSAYKFTEPVRILTSRVSWPGKESSFYTIIALLIFFALVRNSSRRYINEILNIFFRTSAVPRQNRDHLVQNPLASLMLNIFFILSGALYIALLLHHFRPGERYQFWNFFAYAVAGLLLIYCVKFLVLKLMGWIFQLSDITDTYIFIVFTANKIIGISLIPFIVLLSFGSGTVYEVAMTASVFVICAIFAYRYFLSFISLQRKMEISLFHFVIYLSALEIAPLLLINKLLFSYLGETY